MKARPVSEAGLRRTSTSLLRPSQLALAGALCLAAGLGACKNEEGSLALPDAIAEFLPEDRSVWPESAGGVENATLASVCEDLWEFKLRTSPTWATYLNDPRYNSDLPDLRPTAASDRNAARRGFLARLDGISRSRLSDDDKLTLQLVQHDLQDAIAREELELGAWNVSSLGGPQVQFLSLAADQPIGTPRERADLLSRWRSMATSLRQQGRNLEDALDAGAVASRTQVEKVLAQLENLLATPPHLSPLVEPATGGGTWADLAPGGNVTAFAAEHLGDARRNQELRKVNLHLADGLTLAQGTPVLLPAEDDILPPRLRGRFLADVWTTVEDDLYPAFREYKHLLETRILPRARPDERAGLLFVPGGTELYQQCIESFTTLPLTPEEIHATGTAEVERLTAAMVSLGRSLFGTGAVADMRTLREAMESNPDLHYTSREEIQAVAEDAVARMSAALPTAFGRLPYAPVEVVRVPAHEEAFTTMAYYRGPAPDGSRPGRYYVNTYDPPSKPRWEAEVLAFHEAVPGHHLQIALAGELGELPLVRRHMGIGAYVEGWALYTETLADELGLYSGDLDRLGMLSFDAWRSARLVVDTGLHALGWSRDRAIRYMEQNTLADRRNIENEVDRYISWPGQALGYKIGQLELLSLREEARAALGAGFDLRAFHGVVLESGAVTLPVLRERVRAWVAELRPQPEVD